MPGPPPLGGNFTWEMLVPSGGPGRLPVALDPSRRQMLSYYGSSSGGTHLWGMSLVIIEGIVY